MSEPAAMILQPLRIHVDASDPARRAQLEELVLASGHMLASLDYAEIVISDVRSAHHAAFEELREPAPPHLTPRETEVLALISDGLSNKEIARRLEISLHTVKFHIESLLRKLGARTRAEAVAKSLARRGEV
jgi:DNA-binding CsgD family transcriptional regulator